MPPPKRPSGPGFSGWRPRSARALTFLTTADDLIAATEKLSLTAIESLHLALPAHHQAILQAIQTELAKLKPEIGPQPKLHFWSPSREFAGKTFKTKAELEQQLQAVARKLEQLLEEGYTIIVE